MVIVSLKSAFLLRSGFLSPLNRSLQEEINSSQEICPPAATPDLLCCPQALPCCEGELCVKKGWAGGEGGFLCRKKQQQSVQIQAGNWQRVHSRASRYLMHCRRAGICFYVRFPNTLRQLQKDTEPILHAQRPI